MNSGLRRLSAHSSLAFFTVALSMTTGCSLLSAAGNPGAAWAISDPAPLQVVVRRADAAQITTVEVNRLLTQTPAGKDTPWVAAVSPDPKEAAADIKALQADPDYATTHARVVSAEVWIRTLPNVTAATGEHPNLLAAIDQGLADDYSAIGAKETEIAGYKAQVETEKAALDAKDITPADKKTHQDAEAALEKQEDDAEKAVDPLKKTFLGHVKDACAKLGNDDKARYAPAVASLLQALADADIANSAAALKYPIVIKTLPDALKKVIPSIAADVVEEQTGVRPNLANLKVSINISGSSVAVSLDGLGDLGALKPADVITETTKRSVAWFTHTLTLLGTISSTKEQLTFERDVLGQMNSVFAPAAPALVVVKIPAFDSVEVTSAVPAKSISLAARVHAKTVASTPVATATTSATVSATAKPAATGKKDPKASNKPSSKKQK